MCTKCEDTGLVAWGTQQHPFGSTYATEVLYEPCDCYFGLLQMGYTEEGAREELACNAQPAPAPEQAAPEPMRPLWICMTCKTVIGPIVDDNENRCKCPDDYLIDLRCVIPEQAAPVAEGPWAADDLRRAVVEGAKWWEYQQHNATMWNSDVRLAEEAAERLYPGGRPSEELLRSTTRKAA